MKGGGHGNYKAFTVAPASAQEMCDLTILAFRMATKWRTPAIVFADGLQGQMMESVKLPDVEDAKPDFSDWAAQGEAKTRTNLVKSIFLDAAQQEEFNRKLQDKYAKMEEDALSETYLADDADILIVAYGISSRIARTTAETLRADGIKAGCFRPITLRPFPCKALADAADDCWKALLAKDVTAWGKACTAAFEAQVAMFPNMVSPHVQKAIDEYKDCVKGYKITGAGGGGYLVIINDTPIKNAIQIRIRRN